METFYWELESPATNHNEKRFVEKLERDKKKANRYLIVDMVCYSLIPIIIVGVIFLLGRNIYLFSILCGIIAAAFVWRVRQKWWSSVNIRQFIERETGNDNLLQAAWIGMHREERLGFFDLVVQRAWQVVHRFEIPPPWPVRVSQTIRSFIKRKWRWILLGILIILLLLALLLALRHWLPGFHIGNGEQTKKQAVSSQEQRSSKDSENKSQQGDSSSQDANKMAQGGAIGKTEGSSNSDKLSGGQGGSSREADTGGNSSGTDGKSTDAGSQGNEAGSGTGNHPPTGSATPDPGKGIEEHKLSELPGKSGGKAQLRMYTQKGGISDIFPFQIRAEDSLPAGRSPREYRKFLQTP